jgi:hypothetical protein
MAFDPDAYLAGDFDPDKYLGSFDPDQYLAQEPNSFKEFIKNSAVGNIPMGIARGGNLALRGLDMAAAKAAGMFGQQEEADRIIRESDSRSASIDQFAQENFGQGKAAELGQGLGSLPAMIASPTAIPAAIGGLTELQRTLDVQGVDPQTAADVASRQAVANTVLGATPFAPFSRVAGATANVTAGGVADYLSQSKLKEQGYGQIAEDQFNPFDPTQRAIDALGGFAAPVGKPTKGQPKSDTVLQNLNKLDEVKEQQKLTQGEGTLYVGKDGDVTRDLPRKVEESPGELDIIRTELQNRLQDEATRTEGQDPQLPLFDENGRVVETQLDLGLQTKPSDQLPAANAAIQKVSDTATIGDRFTLDNVPTVKNKLGQSVARPEDILSYIEKLPVRPVMADFAVVLPKVRGMLEMFGKNLGLEVVLGDTDMVAARTTDGSKDVPGFYDPVSHQIVLGKVGMQSRVFVHELMHGITVRYIEAFPNSPATKQLQDLFDELKYQDGFKSEYGTTDLAEFISEAFSSVSFKNKLRQLKSDVFNQFKNAYEVVVDAIGQMFKIATPAEQSSLLKVMDTVEQIVKNYAADPNLVNKVYQSKLKSGTLPSQQIKNIIAEGGQHAENTPLTVNVADADTAKSNLIKATTGVDYIPTDPKVTPELIQKIAKEQDGSGVWAFTPGANARAELANSTLVKTVYRLMNNAFKRSDKFSRDVVQPVEKTISKLLNQGEKGKILHQVLMRELANKSDYTPDELRAAGVPDDVIMSHLEFRAMMDQALEKQNQILRDKGKKPVTAIDAYVSARWSGPWRASVKDSEGNIIFQVAEHSKGAAKSAIEYIKSRYKEAGMQFDDVKYREGFEKGDNIEASYLDMLELLDPDDTRVATLKSIYEDYVMGRTEDVASQEKHFKKKTGVGGYAGNRPWAKNDAKEMFVQQFLYAKNAAKWADAQKAMESAKLLLNDPTLQELQKNNIAYSKEYVKNQLGFGTTKVFEAIDNALAKTLRVSPTKLQEYMGGAKTFFYLSRLGLSMPFTIAQFLQPAITNPAGHAKLSAEGFKHNPVVSTWRSVYHGLAASAYHYAPNKLQQSQAKEMLGTLGLEAAKYMDENAVIDINPLSDIKRNLRPQTVKAIAAPFEFTIRHSEIIARSMAFMGYVSHLEQSGQFDTKTQKGRQALFEKAEEMTAFSMTDYRPQERALAFERGGLFGDAAATLHSYQINNLMQATKYLKMAKGGDPLPLFYFFGMQALAGGLTGLWFVEDMDDFLENLKKMLPHDAYMKVKDFSLKNIILDNFGTLGAYGLASSVSGTNIHTRMSAGSQIPVWPFESDSTLAGNVGNVFPFAGVGIDAVAGTAGALSPSSTPQERMVSARQAFPMVAQGPMERFEPFTTRTDQGIISRSPTDPSKGKYMRTEEEQSLRDTGFTSTKEQRFKDKDFALSKIERGLQDRINTAGKKAKEFMVGGKPAQATDQILRYDELGGDVESLINSFPQAYVDRLTTEVYRRAKAAEGGSKPAILKLQRYLEQHGDSTNR